jgi:ribosomal protein L7/L12
MSIPVVIIILLAILLAAWAWFRFAGRAAVPPATGATRQDWGSDSEVRLLLQRGQKIEAIKLLVSTQKLGLKEAKDAVEMLERTGVLPPRGAGTVLRVLTPEAVAEIKTLAAAGRTIDAIRLYRERTGADLKESKAAVEALSTAR